MKRPLIFLDMDGVIADFVTPACAAVGKPGARITTWDMPTELGISADEFWKAQDDRPCFWLDLLPYEGAKAWVDHLRDLGDLYFCTSPSQHAFCASHKVAWLKKHIGSWIVGRYFICKAKHLLASDSGCILIDDSDGNVIDWTGAGGTAITFPRPWNACGGMTEDAARLFVNNHLDLIINEGHA